MTNAELELRHLQKMQMYEKEPGLRAKQYRRRYRLNFIFHFATPKIKRGGITCPSKSASGDLFIDRHEKQQRFPASPFQFAHDYGVSSQEGTDANRVKNFQLLFPSK